MPGKKAVTKKSSTSRKGNSPRKTSKSKSASRPGSRRSSGASPLNAKGGHASRSGSRAGSAASRTASAGSGNRRSSSKTETKGDAGAKSVKNQLKEALARVAELQGKLEETESQEVLTKQQEMEIEALTRALEDEEANKRAELQNVKELHRGNMEKMEHFMRGQRSGFDAEKQGYINAISVLTRTCTNERQEREDERIRYVERVATLQSEEPWLENALALVQDNKWLDYDSDASQQEYERLTSLYGIYLTRKEEGLLALWMALGGTSGWRRKIRPSQLQLLLSRVDFNTLTFRVHSEYHLELGGMVVPEEEVAGFFSCLLSRVGTLQHLAFLDSPVSPVDWTELSPPLIPFPRLQSLALWHTRISAFDVVELVRRLPTLNPCGFQTIVNGLSIHESCLDLQDYTLDKLNAICGRKLWIWGAMVSDVSNIAVTL